MDDLETGWLLPSGEFIECKPWEHNEIAEEIIKKLDAFDKNRASDDVLIENGWIRISFLTCQEHGYSFSTGFGKYATEEQRIFLRNFFTDNQSWISSQGLNFLFHMDVISSDEYAHGC